MVGMRHNSKQSGFTTIELLVVVFILAIISGAVLTAIGPGFIEDQENTATRYEMTQIRDAILKFKQDNPNFLLDSSTLCTPADASFLIKAQYSSSPTTSPCTLDTAHTAWDPDYRLGWQGPYLTKVGDTQRTISGNFEFDGGTGGVGSDIEQVNVLTDPYGELGNPYFFFDLENDDLARIISFGQNEIYESELSGCDDGGDDLVVCLR